MSTQAHAGVTLILVLDFVEEMQTAKYEIIFPFVPVTGDTLETLSQVAIGQQVSFWQSVKQFLTNMISSNTPTH